MWAELGAGFAMAGRDPAFSEHFMTHDCVLGVVRLPNLVRATNEHGACTLYFHFHFHLTLRAALAVSMLGVTFGPGPPQLFHSKSVFVWRVCADMQGA